MNKEGKIAVETLVRWILIIAFLVIIIAILSVTIFKLGPSDMQPVVRYIMNGARSITARGYISWAMPTMTFDMEDVGKINMEGLAERLRTTWYMYGRGRFNLGMRDSQEVVYAFRLEEGFSLQELFTYLQTHNRGNKVTGVGALKSDYNYIQEGSEGQTICVDKFIATEGARNFYFEKDKTYYIIFYDDAGITEYGDKILISRTPSVAGGAPFQCPSASGTIFIRGMGLLEFAVRKDV